MSGIVNSIMSFIWGATAPPPKKYDVENPPDGKRRHGEMRVPLPVMSAKSIGIVSYTREIAVPVCLATLGTSQGSAALRYTDENYESQPQERLADKSDIVIKLADLITTQNFYIAGDNNDDSDEAHRWQTKFDNGRAVVVEIAIKVIDQRWNPHRHYLRIETSELPALQYNTIVIGDRSSVLSHAIARRTLPPHAAKSCGLPGVAGWCHECSAGPNMVTVYQMPLVNGDLFKYATEILSSTGTHGHLRAAPGIQADGTESGDTRLELSPLSTIARDLCFQRRATHQIDTSDPGGRTNVFASNSDWAREVRAATDSVFVNVPYADLKHATIRIAARGDSSSVQETLQVRIAVQCVGLYE